MTKRFGRLLRLPAVCEQTGDSPATVYRKMKEGIFPLAVVLGPNSRAWIETEIETYKAALIAARDDGTDAELRVVNPNIGRGRPRKTEPSILARYDCVDESSLSDNPPVSPRRQSEDGKIRVRGRVQDRIPEPEQDERHTA